MHRPYQTLSCETIVPQQVRSHRSFEPDAGCTKNRESLLQALPGDQHRSQSAPATVLGKVRLSFHVQQQVISLVPIKTFDAS